MQYTLRFIIFLIISTNVANTLCTHFKDEDNKVDLYSNLSLIGKALQSNASSRKYTKFIEDKQFDGYYLDGIFVGRNIGWFSETFIITDNSDNRVSCERDRWSKKYLRCVAQYKRENERIKNRIEDFTENHSGSCELLFGLYEKIEKNTGKKD